MVYASLDIEKSLWSAGYQLVCGVDEVGRGCFAGSVVAAAVVFPPSSELIPGLADSKLLTPGKREDLDKLIKKLALFYAIAEVSVTDINKVGIGKATQMAFAKAIVSLRQDPDFLLTDAFYILNIDQNKQQPIKHGDRISASIAAASIIAKVYRDKLMGQLHEKFPEYGFNINKGYGTKVHQEAIKQYGLCKLHRTSFNLSKFL